MDFIAALAGTEDFVLTWDIAVIIFVFIAGFLYGLHAGRKKLVLFILTVYTSFVALQLFPFLGSLTGNAEGISSGAFEIITFAIFVFVLYYVFSGSILKVAVPIPKKGKTPFWQTAALSITISGFLLSIFFVTLDKEISQLTLNTFATSTAHFIWALLPLLVIALVRRSKEG